MRVWRRSAVILMSLGLVAARAAAGAAAGASASQVGRSGFVEGLKHSLGVVVELGRAFFEVVLGGGGRRSGWHGTQAEFAVPASQPLHALLFLFQLGGRE